ncbi:MAG: hypothetical protein EOO41_04740, partial [Methanobacteriota archaeon]
LSQSNSAAAPELQRQQLAPQYAVVARAVACLQALDAWLMLVYLTGAPAAHTASWSGGPDLAAPFTRGQLVHAFRARPNGSDLQTYVTRLTTLAAALSPTLQTSLGASILVRGATEACRSAATVLERAFANLKRTAEPSVDLMASFCKRHHVGHGVLCNDTTGSVLTFTANAYIGIVEAEQALAELRAIPGSAVGNGPLAYQPSEALDAKRSSLLLPDEHELVCKRVDRVRQTLCWARVKGFPFWPAARVPPHAVPKAMKEGAAKETADGKLLVRLIGPHPDISAGEGAGAPPPPTDAQYAWVKRTLVRPWGKGAASDDCPNWHAIDTPAYTAALADVEALLQKVLRQAREKHAATASDAASALSQGDALKSSGGAPHPEDGLTSSARASAEGSALEAGL